jgi:hypothetical protein
MNSSYLVMDMGFNKIRFYNHAVIFYIPDKASIEEVFFL